jgi:hypothetical protein
MPIPDSEVTKGGMSDQEVFNPPPSMARAASDWATSFIRGLAKGTEGMAGLPGDVAEMGARGIDMAARYVGDAVGVDVPKREDRAPTYGSAAVDKLVGGKEGDRNVVGKFIDEKSKHPYAESVGEFVPGLVGGGEGALAKTLLKKGAQAVGGGVGSEVGGEIARSEAAKNLVGDHETAARVLVGIVGQGFPGAVRKAIAPSNISPERQAAVDVLRKEGVEPTAGDVTGSKSLKRAESTLGGAPGAGGAYEEAREKIGDQFTRAALKRIGEDADRATPEVMERAATRIGKQFDDLSARNSAKPDMKFAADVLKAQQDYDHLFVDPLKKPIVEKVVENTMNHIKNGTISGETYKAQRSMLERMRRGYKQDPEVSGFLAEVRDALDEVMERSIAKNNPSDLGAWKDVRNQYRNMLTLERVTSGAGEAAAEGIVSPARLRQAAVATGGKKSYAQGGGDFGELSRAGNSILTQPTSSNTAERGFLHALAGGALHPSTWASLIAPGTAGKTLMSKTAQDYLKNKLADKLHIDVSVLDQMKPKALDKIVRSALAAHNSGPTELPPITVDSP